MDTQKNLLKAQCWKASKIICATLALTFAVSCAKRGDEKMIMMSDYNYDQGQKPEFRLRGYEDYKIKLSREDVRVENKISFDDIGEMFTFDND